MSNALPLQQIAAGAPYRGAVINVALQDGALTYSVGLLREDRTTKPVLSTEDENAARRVWRLLARVLHCPRMIADGNGGIQAVESLSGQLLVRPPIPRRPGRPLRRRPSSRRALPAVRPNTVHSGEWEIICYE